MQKENLSCACRCFKLFLPLRNKRTKLVPDKRKKEKKMSSSEKQNSKFHSEPTDAGLTEAPQRQLQLRSASGHADTGYLAGTSFQNFAALPEVAGSAMSLLSGRSADLEDDKPFAFYPSADRPSEEHRPSLVDAVIEQLRHAKLRRQRPH